MAVCRVSRKASGLLVTAPMRRCALAAPKTHGAHELCAVIPDSLDQPMVLFCSRCGDVQRVSMALPLPMDDMPSDVIARLARRAS